MKAVFIMTKLVKKSVDVEKVLSKPRQSWLERLMVWGLSKLAIATVFVAIMGWFGKAFAQSANGDAWILFQYTRKWTFICGFFLMLICAVLAFKKVSWFVLLNILSWLSFVAMVGLTIDILTEDEYPFELDFETFAIFIAAIVLFLLPFLISFIQYKRKKIDKKLLKRRLLIWIAPACMLCGIIIAIAFILFTLFMPAIF